MFRKMPIIRASATISNTYRLFLKSVAFTGYDVPVFHRRCLSSNPVSKKVRNARKNSVTATLDNSTLSIVANAQLSKVVAAVQRMKDDNSYFVVGHEKDRVTIDLGPKYGEYVISYESQLGVLQLASPRSGGFVYVYDELSRKWKGRTDGHDFEGMLTRDLIQQANGYPDF